MTEVLTKWHRFVDALNNKHVAVNAGKSRAPFADQTHHGGDLSEACDYPHLMHVPSLVEKIPKFFLTDDILEMSLTDAMMDSLEAMHLAGVAKLPFPNVLVEYDRTYEDGTKSRMFIMISERATVDETEDDDTEFASRAEFPFVATLFRLRVIQNIETAVVSPCKYFVGMDSKVIHDDVRGDIEPEFGWNWKSAPAPYMDLTEDNAMAFRRAMQEVAGIDSRFINQAISAIILTMSTKGIEAVERAPSDKLNKARSKSRKSAIPAYNLIHISHYYTRSGEKRAYDENAKRTVRVHWRRAHYRRVRYGAGHSLLSEPRFFPAMLVNYAGGDKPAPTYKVTL